MIHARVIIMHVWNERSNKFVSACHRPNAGQRQIIRQQFRDGRRRVIVFRIGRFFMLPILAHDFGIDFRVKLVGICDGMEIELEDWSEVKVKSIARPVGGFQL